MRCRKICRELLWLARFGEFGPSSAPHLEHLAHCGNCREEVGFDRALVQQLRRSLAERIENAAPSAAAWGAILERAQAPESGIGAFLHRHAGALAARLRLATAITAMGLAGLIATSTHVAITHPDAGSAETEVLTSGAGEQFERQALLPRSRVADERIPVAYVATAVPSDPEMAFLVSASLVSTPSVTEPSTLIPAEPDTDEPRTIQSTLSLGPTQSRSTPIDPVDDGRSASVAPVLILDEEAPVGEPF